MTTYQFAGFWRRFVAYSIDGFIISIIFFILGIIAAIAYFAGAMAGDSRAWVTGLTDPGRMAEFTTCIWLFTMILNMAYFTYFHGSNGRTPGKMLMGLQVISIDGKPISFGIAFLRSVGYLVSSIVFCLGYIWIAFDKKKQGWHDKIAGTVVIVREPQGSDNGISILDSASGAQSSVQFSNPSDPVSSMEMKRPEMQSNEDVRGADGQKIP